ncbi:hypothetical protein LL364_004359 [Citrobacter freundii]|nr:hypothetical protein [Citrobacter freundii]
MSTNYGKSISATGGEIPSCLCKQIMHHPAVKPKLVRSEKRNEYLMFCPSCGFRTHPDWCRNAVIAEWCGANKSGDQHIQELWLKRYTEQQNESLAKKINI